jgi:signal transduction histidine kinase
LEQLLLSVLLMLNKVQGISDVPASVPSSWVSENVWKQTGSGITFEASSTELASQCRQNPKGFVKFPLVLYGAHEITFDNGRPLLFGHPDMQEANYVVSAPVLECAQLADVSTVHWKAHGYSKYFAHVSSFPEFTEHKPFTHLFGETLYIGSAIGLIILSIFALSVLYGRESNALLLALCSSICGITIYFLTLVAPSIEVSMPVLTLHKIGDFSLALGISFVIACFYIERLIPRWLFIAQFIATASALPFVLFGTNGNSVQFGTSLPMPTVLMSFGLAAYSLSRKFYAYRSIESAFIFLFSAIFFFVIYNDISVFTGSADGYTFMPVGVLLAYLILILGVNQRISAAYTERDYLRANLEVEVERKTAELKLKTAELETTMKDLRHTQAELIHSAKLASLGTLSAGIAHEINNSINFVNGAIVPLEKMIAKLEHVSAKDYEMGRKLLAAIRDGISITVEIVKSLRQFTGLNQAKLKDMHLLEVVRSVLVILRPKLKDQFEVFVNVPESLTLYGDVVGFNQILMNLITNAIDAMPNGGSISITASDEGDNTVVCVADSGTGIPAEVKARIFDPFFTTKEVGSGTGLGLYIVNKEIDRHKGKIAVDSEDGKGTTFRLTFPKRGERAASGEAA